MDQKENKVERVTYVNVTKSKPIGIIKERNTNVNKICKTICVDVKSLRNRDIANNVVQVKLCDNGSLPVVNSGQSKVANSTTKLKIPRPPNAFMLFANEWRKKLASQNPRESNKDISVRLGALWKNMSKEIKEKYFARARLVDAEHKKKYPDYVYNPKEARLRKAMREQSRELSRQSILQTTITSSSPNESTGSDCISSSAVANFSHPHAMNCVTSPVSMLTPSIDNRIIGPWFPVGQPAPASHLEPVHAPKVMATHQRTIDKSKEDIRKQVERGSVGFSGVMPPNHSYHSEFTGHGPVSAVHRDNDYCMMSELSEPPKWHPYQNGVNMYQMRNSMMPKVGSMHCNMSSSGHRPPSHWGQFCSMPLPNLNENATMRSPRHLTYLQEQQSQHCATPVVYPDDMQIPYRSNQMDVNSRPALSYQQSDEHRVTDLEKVPVMMRAQRYEETVKTPETCCPRREPVAQAAPSSVSPTVTPVESSSESLNSRSASASPVEESQQYQEKVDQKKNRTSKQPLPGFHQAFGSTEIGRFSRSEFFASMMADEHSLVPNGFIRAPMYPYPAPPIYQDNFPSYDENLMLHHPNGPGQYFYMNSMPNPEIENQNFVTFVDCSRHANSDWQQMPFMDRPMMRTMPNMNYHYHDMNYQSRDSEVPSQGLDLRLPEKSQSSKSPEAEFVKPKAEIVDQTNKSDESM